MTFSMNLRLLSICAALSTANVVSAVTFSINIDSVFSGNGTTLVPTNTLAFVVIDKNGDGIDAVVNPALTLGSLIGADDYVAWKGSFANGDTGVFSDVVTFSIGNANVPNNAAMAFVWFPGLTTSSSTLLTGQSYGVYTSASATQFGSTSAWNVGANNAATYTLNVFTATNTGALGSPSPLAGGLSNTALSASKVVGSAIPEPSTWASIFGFAAIGLAF